METHSAVFLRKRRFMVMLPLLVLPFLTFLFWVLGGGKNANAQSAQQQSTGLNMELPGAITGKDDEDKLKIYEKVLADSIKLAEARKMDPYFKLSFGQTGQFNNGRPSQEKVDKDLAALYNSIPESRTDGQTLHGNSPYETIDPNEEKVYQKIAQLNKELNRASEPAKVNSNQSVNDLPAASLSNSNISRLDESETGLASINESIQVDPEIKQYESLLNKIMDVQHPDRIRDSIKKESARNKQQVFIVSSLPVQENSGEFGISEHPTKENIDSMDGLLGNNFYSDEEDDSPKMMVSGAIEAEVHGKQVLTSGATIRLRLTNDVFIQAILVPANTFIYGIATLNNDRLEIAIPSIRYRQSIFPVELKVYDLDGLPGVYIPGAIGRDVAKSSTDEALQSIDVGSYNPSVAAQAASAGIQAAKTFLGKKVKLVRVTIKASYRVLLKSTSAQ
jgi:conjugative transposon TraM protein